VHAFARLLTFVGAAVSSLYCSEDSGGEHRPQMNVSLLAVFFFLVGRHGLQVRWNRRTRESGGSAHFLCVRDAALQLCLLLLALADLQPTGDDATECQDWSTHTIAKSRTRMRSSTSSSSSSSSPLESSPVCRQGGVAAIRRPQAGPLSPLNAKALPLSATTTKRCPPSPVQPSTSLYCCAARQRSNGSSCES
jgi:hypothetical protein